MGGSIPTQQFRPEKVVVSQFDFSWYSPDTLLERDTILAVLSSGIALAGLLLIFSGLLFAKAASFETRRGERYRWFAGATLIPVLAALALSWMSVRALEGNEWASANLLTGTKITLALTGLFAIIGVIFSA
jgi:hypothetical protein